MDVNPLHCINKINKINKIIGHSTAGVMEFIGITDPAVDPDGIRERGAMASIVYFRKTMEESDSVRYVFGFEPEEMTCALLMDPGTRRAQAEDGDIDYEFLRASRRINAMFEARDEWPERGMGAS